MVRWFRIKWETPEAENTTGGGLEINDDANANANANAKDLILIKLQFYNVIGWVDSEDADIVSGEVTWGEDYVLAERQIKASFSGSMLWSETGTSVPVEELIYEFIGEIFCLDDKEHQLGIAEIISGKAEAAAITLQHINVGIGEVTLQLHRLKFVPASKSSIDGLEKLLDAEGTASCAICMEGFSDFIDHDEAAAAAATSTDDDDDDEDEDGRLLARLPCLHLYHSDCIVRWLEISHVCPVCRFPMPVDQADEPSEPSNTMATLGANEPSEH